jgi:ketosteroid isomerase-like protein
MSQRLPKRPHFELLRRHAKDVLRVGRILYPAWRLADAQHALARGHGFASWGDLKRGVAFRRAVGQTGRDALSSPMRASVPQTSAAVKPAVISGIWLTQDDATTDCVALEIAGGAHSLVLTQVVASADGRVVGNNLTIRPDGREHLLDVGEELRLQAAWSDVRTLQTIVRRAGVTVAEGTYVVSLDGNTMTATSSGQSRIFGRVGNAVGRHTARRPRGRASSNRTALFIGVAVIAAGAYGCAGVRSPKAIELRHDQEDVDRRAIDVLNRHDVAAGLANDMDAVISQWTDDFVLLPPAGPIVRGKTANAAMMEGARQHLQKFEPVAYEVQFEEITVAGDYAFAWGLFRSVARVRETARDVVSTGKLLRIYRRQPDGHWLMHRTMSTIDALPQQTER